MNVEVSTNPFKMNTVGELFSASRNPRPQLANFIMASVLAHECFPIAYRAKLDSDVMNLMNAKCRFIPIYNNGDLYFAFLEEKDGHYVADARVKDVASVCDLRSPMELPRDVNACGKITVQPRYGDYVGTIRATLYNILMSQKGEYEDI